MAKKRKKDNDTIRADFGHKDAKSGGGGRNPRLPEGDYKAKIISAEKKESKNSGNTYIKYGFQILEGKHKGKKLSGNATITPKALFWLRNMLEALGVEVPERAVNLKYKKYVGSKIGITLEDDEYEGKIKSEVSDFLDYDMVGAADDDEDEDDDDLDDDDVDEDEDDESDLDDMDRKELKAYIKDNDLDVKVTKKMDEDDIREAIGEAEGDEDDDDEDDDDDLDEVDLEDL